METREYFEKVMQDFNQHRNGRSLRKYCQVEGIDYKWLQEYKKTYPNETSPSQRPEPDPQSFIPLAIEEEKDRPQPVWQVSHLRLESPDGGFIDINIRNLQTENVRLRNLLADKDALVESMKQDKEEWTKDARVGYITLEEHLAEMANLRTEKDERIASVTAKCDEEHRLRVSAEARVKELEDAALKNEEAHKEELAKFNEVQEMADKANANEIDMMSIVRVIQNRLFNHNSDRIRFLNSQLDKDGLGMFQNKFCVESRSALPLRSSKNSLERIPQTIEQYKEKNASLAKDIPLLKEIANKQWKKEDELKGLKSELAAIDRKIQLELAKDKEPQQQQAVANGDEVVEVSPHKESQGRGLHP